MRRTQGLRSGASHFAPSAVDCRHSNKPTRTHRPIANFHLPSGAEESNLAALWVGPYVIQLFIAPKSASPLVADRASPLRRRGPRCSDGMLVLRRRKFEQRQHLRPPKSPRPPVCVGCAGSNQSCRDVGQCAGRRRGNGSIGKCIGCLRRQWRANGRPAELL